MVRLLPVPNSSFDFTEGYVPSAIDGWGTQLGTHKNFILPEFQNTQ